MVLIVVLLLLFVHFTEEALEQYQVGNTRAAINSLIAMAVTIMYLFDTLR